MLTQLLAQVEGTTHFVYWQVTRGINDRNHVYPEGMPGKLWVMIRPNHLNDPDVPIKLVTAPDTRFYHCNIKTLNLIPSVIAAQDAARRGVQETVFHRDGIVTECAHSNVSILKDGVFYSHPNDELILRGIAKTHMIGACYRLGITVMEKPFTLEDLRAADEIIVTSSSNFCLHACELDGVPAGGKDPATLKAIQDAVLQEYYDYTARRRCWTKAVSAMTRDELEKRNVGENLDALMNLDPRGYGVCRILYAGSRAFAGQPLTMQAAQRSVMRCTPGYGGDPDRVCTAAHKVPEMDGTVSSMLLARALVLAFGAKPVIVCPADSVEAIRRCAAVVGLHCYEDLETVKSPAPEHGGGGLHQR